MSGADGLVLLELKPELRERLGLPELRFPVRRGRLAAVMSGDRLRLDLLLDELDRFLADRPELCETYSAAGAALAHIAGVELGSQGFHPGARHCFEIGLALAPDSDSLRLNYALALMAGGDQAGALRQLKLVMAAHRDAGPDPLIWTLAGRLCTETGDHARAARLLGEVAAFGPTEDSFWELLAQAEERARPIAGTTGTAGAVGAAAQPPGKATPIPMAKPVSVPLAKLIPAQDGTIPVVPVVPAAPVQPPAEPPAEPRSCPACRTALPAGAKFCPQCGAGLGV